MKEEEEENRQERLYEILIGQDFELTQSTYFFSIVSHVIFPITPLFLPSLFFPFPLS